MNSQKFRRSAEFYFFITKGCLTMWIKYYLSKLAYTFSTAVRTHARTHAHAYTNARAYTHLRSKLQFVMALGSAQHTLYLPNLLSHRLHIYCCNMPKALIFYNISEHVINRCSEDKMKRLSGTFS